MSGKYDVDIRFSPVVCIRGVAAGSQEEANRIVWNMIDDGTLKLTEAQRESLLADLFENVEEVG